MHAKYKLLVTAAMFSGFAGSAAAQDIATWSPRSGQSLFQALGITTQYNQARSHIIIHAQKPVLIVENTAQRAVKARRRGHLPASPPFAGKDTSTRLGSISPLTDQSDPNQSRQVREMEPILKMAENQPTTLVMNEAIDETDETIEMSSLPQDEWAQVLAKFTSLDPQNLVRFDYGALQASKADTALLANYIEGLSRQKPSTMPENEAMAYWANLYNALTVQVVAQNYPVKSIRNIKSGRRKGPWKRNLVTVEGKELTLDNIEHDIMRPTYKTPLVHYMVNCASIGCPNLKTSPWQAETLEVDIEIAARAYINSSRGVVFNKNRVQVSRIYRWFKKDFGNSESGVLAHLMKYADADLHKRLKDRSKIDKYGYDWALNAP